LFFFQFCFVRWIRTIFFTKFLWMCWTHISQVTKKNKKKKNLHNPKKISIRASSFLFFWKLYCIQIGNHSEKYLPNFGYTPHMKIQKIKNHFFIRPMNVKPT
jgi:hypothetical protein